MGKDGLFNLAGEDIEPFVQDHVFLAVGDRQEAVFVQHPDIPRVNPPIPQNESGFGFVITIAAHHMRALDANFTGFSCRQNAMAAVQINNFNKGFGHRFAHSTGAVSADGGVDGNRSHFRHSVSFIDRQTSQFFPASMHL